MFLSHDAVVLVTVRTRVRVRVLCRRRQEHLEGVSSPYSGGDGSGIGMLDQLSAQHAKINAVDPWAGDLSAASSTVPPPVEIESNHNTAGDSDSDTGADGEEGVDRVGAIEHGTAAGLLRVEEGAPQAKL